MEYGELIMLTGAILVGLVVLTLVAQVLHAVKIHKAEASMNEKLDEIIERLPRDHYSGQSASLEDLINLDLMETMGKVAPMTDRQVQEMVKEIKDDES